VWVAGRGVVGARRRSLASPAPNHGLQPTPGSAVGCGQAGRGAAQLPGAAEARRSAATRSLMLERSEQEPEEEKTMSECIYCKSRSFGSGCPHSPSRKHKHENNGEACTWCGSRSHGSGCPHSPARKHEHGHGGGCVWCGSRSHVSWCPHSPSRVHEH